MAFYPRVVSDAVDRAGAGAGVVPRVRARSLAICVSPSVIRGSFGRALFSCDGAISDRSSSGASWCSSRGVDIGAELFAMAADMRPSPRAGRRMARRKRSHSPIYSVVRARRRIGKLFDDFYGSDDAAMYKGRAAGIEGRARMAGARDHQHARLRAAGGSSGSASTGERGKRSSECAGRGSLAGEPR